MLGKPLTQQAEIGHRAVRPLVAQPASVRALDVDAVIRAGERIEARGVDDDVELERAVGRLEPRGRDPHDRRLGRVDEFDVVAVVRLEVAGLHRQALDAEAVVPSE